MGLTFWACPWNIRLGFARVILGQRTHPPKLAQSGGGTFGLLGWEGLAYIIKQTQGVAAAHIIPRRGGLAEMVLKGGGFLCVQSGPSD